MKTLLKAAIMAGAAVTAIPAYAAGVTGQVAGPDGSWDYASFDAAHHRVLISRSFGVEALDIGSGALTQIVSTGKTHASFALPDGRLFITNGAASTVLIANGATGAVEATIPVGKDPDGAAYDPSTGFGLAMNADSGDVSVIDLAKNKEAARIAVGGALEFPVVDGAGKLFINVEDKNQIAVVDIKARKVTARYALAGCEGPTGLAYVAPYKLLISTCANGHAKVISAVDGHQVADLAIGPHPDSALYDQARGVAYIPTAGSMTASGEITVVKVAGPKEVSVIGRIPTTRGARTIAEDPATGLLYLPTADYVMGPEGKPKPAPGTFRVLIVTP